MPVSVPFGSVLLFGCPRSAYTADLGLFAARRAELYKEVPNTMAKAGSRVKITLRCSECKQRNYNTNKNKKNTPDRLELNKYCPFCRKHTPHTETK